MTIKLRKGSDIKMKYKLILFDADGTLFDFDSAEKNAFLKTLSSFGVTSKLNELHRSYEKINKAVWQDFQDKKISSLELRTERFRKFFEQAGLKLKAEEISPVYLKNLSMGTDLLPGAEEIVKYFSGKCELALATNGLSDVQRPRFAASKLAPYFQHIFISEEIGHPKPDKEFFDHIFKILPYRDSTIIVGDNFSSDITGGINAGIDTCWFNPDGNNNSTDMEPDFEITDLIDLKQIVKV